MSRGCYCYRHTRANTLRTRERCAIKVAAAAAAGAGRNKHNFTASNSRTPVEARGAELCCAPEHFKIPAWPLSARQCTHCLQPAPARACGFSSARNSRTTTQQRTTRARRLPTSGHCAIVVDGGTHERRSRRSSFYASSFDGSALLLRCDGATTTRPLQFGATASWCVRCGGGMSQPQSQANSQQYDGRRLSHLGGAVAARPQALNFMRAPFCCSYSLDTVSPSYSMRACVSS